MALKGKYMSVEAGSAGGVGFVGSAVEAGGFSAPGIGIGIVNEGPVGAGFRLENTMPYIIGTSNPIEQIAVEPSAPLVIREAESIAAAAWEPEVSEPQISGPIWNGQITEQLLVIPQDLYFQPAPYQTIQEPATDIKPIISSQPENRTSVHQAVSQVLEQPQPQEQEVEEEVIEKVLIENKEKDLEEEELEVNKFVEDEQASSVRKHEIREAVSRAKKEVSRLGLKGIAGWLVAKFLPSEHTGNRSQIIKENGPDGSYTETIEAISEAGQLDPDVAVKRFDLIVEEKKPVKLGKDGQKVEQQDLSRVFKYKLIKPSAQEIIVKRFIKKRVHQSFIQKNDLKTDIKKQEAPEWVSEVGEYKQAA